jgi:CHASE3 domain sensor protein
LRGTGAQLLSCLLEAATPAEAAELLRRAEQAFCDDPKTLKLVRDIVNAKQVGALWADAVEKLRRRGEQLEARAHRDPRVRARRLRLLPGGRRWRRFR